MTLKLVDLETEVDTAAPSQQRSGLTLDTDSHGARPKLPDIASEEYRFLYLPTMLGVYTARHQKMPVSDESLREHVFGAASYAGCQVCREETEFLVAHQKKFF